MQELTPVWFRRLRLRHCELLVELSRQPSLTAAAEALHMTQPAVSQQLADIESACGAALFDRGRGLRPSPIGEALLSYARQVLNGARRVDDEMLAIRSGASGLVRMGAMLVAATVLVPRAIERLQRGPGRVRIELVEDIMQGLWPRLEQGALDIVVGRLDSRVRNGTLPFEALYQDPHFVVCRPDHPLARQRRPKWSDLQRYPWVMPPERTALRAAVDASFHSLDLPTPESRVDSGSLAATLSILARTDFLAVVSRTAGRHYAEQGMLTVLPLQLAAEVGPVGMTWFDRQPNATITRVLEALREEGRTLAAAH